MGIYNIRRIRRELRGVFSLLTSRKCLVSLQISDMAYNRITDFFGERYHCMRFAGQWSSVAEIKASVVQDQQLVQRRTSWQQQTFMLWRRATVSSIVQTIHFWSCRLPTLVHPPWISNSYKLNWPILFSLIHLVNSSSVCNCKHYFSIRCSLIDHFT